MIRTICLRTCAFAALCLGAVSVAPGQPYTPEERFLVLPFVSMGVSDTTVSVFRALLADELEARGVRLVGVEERDAWHHPGIEPCELPDCARDRALLAGAEGVVYGNLRRLGRKVIVRARALRLAEPDPFYRDRLPAMQVEDLDRVALRIAEGIAGGRPDSREATVESVIDEETRKPRLRSTRKGLGIRAGFLVPVDKSYGDVNRLTCFSIPFKFETDDYFLETTTLAGIAFGRSFDAVDWTIFDLFGARVFGLGDRAAYVGAGVGIHSVHAELEEEGFYDPIPPPEASQSATTFAIDAGVGLLLLRTYDFQVVLDLRYHYVFEDFEEVNDRGAHGVRFSFGTNR
ncbi:MAG: hypothetical protein GF328_09945 [Candidatus Latescibacteria bacterium]|nr:hypothetical protein [Candidatus Latescibacterota bacterium]